SVALACIALVTATSAFGGDDLETGIIGVGADAARYVILDPEAFDVRIVYTNPPKSVQEQHREAKAVLTVNGGYWTAEYRPTDLLISDGKRIGSYNRKASFKGLFFVKGSRAAVRDLAKHPWSASEELEQAVRCGPVVVRNGAVVPSKSTTRHRRTVIGRTRDGRIFFVASDRQFWTYDESAAICLRDPINAEFAFQLDGGGSTGLMLDSDGAHAAIPSVAVGSHIQVFRKIKLHP
ncbi:MAG: phosphodiester glycosidase family protein, partial [Deltaproteobacteria bacterium]|nr:phosphodiester glycosidase family protein [Deltaproteobacteria bacterium]